VFDIEFVLAANGRTVGEVLRARGIPAEGTDVVLEHAAFGPVYYHVVRAPQHWYRSRTGRLAKADQYAEASVKVYVTPVEEGR
jgi:hypothetical protein